MKQASNSSNPRGIVGVAGTDTEVGKTIVTASLVLALRRGNFRVGAFKPFASDPARRRGGEGYSTDADLLARAACFSAGAQAICGQHFRAPLAPLAAARIEGRRVRVKAVLRQTLRFSRDFDLTLVEGCGGWEVPLTARRTMADFFADLGAPVLIVARAGLGTINHTLLTAQAVRSRGLTVLGVILNRAQGGPRTRAETTNPDILRSFVQAPVWGPVPHQPALAGMGPEKIAIDSLPDLSDVARRLLRRLDALQRRPL